MDATMARKAAWLNVFDVSGDRWLGEQNGIRLIAPCADSGRALALCENGEMRVYGKAGRVLGHARREGRAAAKEDVMDAAGGEMLAALQAEALEAAVGAACSALYRGLREGEVFWIVDQAASGWKAKQCTKAAQPAWRGLKPWYPHRSDKEGVWWFSGHPRDAILMTADQYAKWETACRAKANEDEMTAEEYHEAHGAVNLQVARVATAIGRRAVTTPFSMRSGSAQVAVGRRRLWFSLDFDDTMSVSMEEGSSTTGRLTGLVSVTVKRPIGGVELSYNEIGSASFALWVGQRGDSGAEQGGRGHEMAGPGTGSEASGYAGALHA